MKVIGDAQPVVEALVEISGARPWDASRSIWLWFAAWCESARDLGVQLTAAKILMFSIEWHESFVAQSGTAWMSLGKAVDNDRERIRTSALAACEDLPSSTVVRMPDGVTVGDIQMRLRGSPRRHNEAPPRPPLEVDPDAVNWLTSGEARYQDMVSGYYGSPESIAAGGHQCLQAGDAAAALFFFQKAIDLLHTLYVISEMRGRVPGAADQEVLTSYLNTVDEVLGLYPHAPIDVSVREVTHRLRTISTRCKEIGIDPSLYLDALMQLGNLAPEVDLHDIL
ncbi:MAG: hypothetical protein ACRDRN_02150 [Sciscionella sp.]